MVYCVAGTVIKEMWGQYELHFKQSMVAIMWDKAHIIGLSKDMPKNCPFNSINNLCKGIKEKMEQEENKRGKKNSFSKCITSKFFTSVIGYSSVLQVTIYWL